VHGSVLAMRLSPPISSAQSRRLNSGWQSCAEQEVEQRLAELRSAAIGAELVGAVQSADALAAALAHLRGLHTGSSADVFAAHSQFIEAQLQSLDALRDESALHALRGKLPFDERGTG